MWPNTDIQKKGTSYFVTFQLQPNTDSVVEKFLILVFQSATRHARYFFVISKSTSFHNFQLKSNNKMWNTVLAHYSQHQLNPLAASQAQLLCVNFPLVPTDTTDHAFNILNKIAE